MNTIKKSLLTTLLTLPLAFNAMGQQHNTGSAMRGEVENYSPSTLRTTSQITPEDTTYRKLDKFSVPEYATVLKTNTPITDEIMYRFGDYFEGNRDGILNDTLKVVGANDVAEDRISLLDIYVLDNNRDGNPDQYLFSADAFCRNHHFSTLRNLASKQYFNFPTDKGTAFSAYIALMDAVRGEKQDSPGARSELEMILNNSAEMTALAQQQSIAGRILYDSFGPNEIVAIFDRIGVADSEQSAKDFIHSLFNGSPLVVEKKSEYIVISPADSEGSVENADLSATMSAKDIQNAYASVDFWGFATMTSQPFTDSAIVNHDYSYVLIELLNGKYADVKAKRFGGAKKDNTLSFSGTYLGNNTSVGPYVGITGTGGPAFGVAASTDLFNAGPVNVVFDLVASPFGGRETSLSTEQKGYLLDVRPGSGRANESYTVETLSNEDAQLGSAGLSFQVGGDRFRMGPGARLALNQTSSLGTSELVQNIWEVDVNGTREIDGFPYILAKQGSTGSQDAPVNRKSSSVDVIGTLPIKYDRFTVTPSYNITGNGPQKYGVSLTYDFNGN